MPESPRPIHILLAEDGSEHSLAAVAMLRDLPLPPGSTVKVVAAMGARQGVSPGALQSALEEACALLEQKGVTVTAELLKTGEQQTGDAHKSVAAVLTAYADHHRPDLMVLGARGLRATAEILLGGVAQQVVEYSNWPVLVVRAPYIQLKRVLVVTDGSAHSRSALDYLVGTPSLGPFPLPEDIEVKALHVLAPYVSPDVIAQTWALGPEPLLPISPSPVVEEDWRNAEAEEAAELLKRCMRRLEQAGFKASAELRQGDAATEIIEAVEAEGINLIVAGSRGLGGVRGWLLGSVTRKLVHYANCSVMIVRSPML
jgi:nucleotide-binding universal stress UspA family protein